MAIPESESPKSKLRATMRRLLRVEKPDSQAVNAAFDQWLGHHPDLKTIAVFSALDGEPDLAKTIARHDSRHWVYPRICGDLLIFHHVADPASGLRTGAFRILEPDPTLPEIKPCEIDAFICPGLAFDHHGGRLGRGRGFYDRILATARPDALKIGVCFPYQIVADTFSEGHDVPMELVLF